MKTYTMHKEFSLEKGFIEILILLIAIPFVIVGAFLITYMIIVRPYQITGNAMDPNYTHGQYYLAQVAGYGTPQRKDVVVFRSPQKQNVELIKRVIGLPGEKVSVKDGGVYVNGTKLNETSYINSEITTYGGAFIKDGQEMEVPTDHYFVLGDNRPFSSDSREWGFLPKKNIIGKMAICYYKCN